MKNADQRKQVNFRQRIEKVEILSVLLYSRIHFAMSMYNAYDSLNMKLVNIFEGFFLFKNNNIQKNGQGSNITRRKC